MEAIVFGGSGLTGKSLVNLLLSSDEYSKVTVFLRKRLEVDNDKLVQHIINFDELEKYSDLIKGDILFHCLGTTIKDAGSQAMFTKVDLEYPSEYAGIAKKNGVKKIIAISSIGTRPNTKNFYIRTKWDLEAKIKSLNFETAHIMRPSLLIGKRDKSRIAEQFGRVIIKALSVIMIGTLRRYKVVKIENLAKRMYQLSLENKTGYFVHESETIN